MLADVVAEVLDGLGYRHPAKPPHEQWMHAGKAKGLAKEAIKAAVKEVVAEVLNPGPQTSPPPKLPSKATGWIVSTLLPLFSVGEVVGTWKAKNGNKVVAEYRLVKTAQGKGPSAVSISVKHAGTGGDFVPAGMTNEEKSSFVVGKVWAINGGGKPKASSPSPKTSAAPASPVGDVTSLPKALRQDILNAYKAQPKGQMLSAPASESYDNLVALAHAYGTKSGGALAPLQVAQIVDMELSSNLGMGNQKLLENKLVDWLQTSNGAAYAKAHTTPKASILAGLSGGVQLPKGVQLAPSEKVQKLTGPGPYKDTDTDFLKITANGMQKSQDDYVASQGSALTGKQKKALHSYSQSGNYGMNNYLRGKTKSVPLPVQQSIVDVQSAMMPLQQNTLLLRGTGWEQLPAGYRDKNSVKKLIGKHFEEPGFTSTSVAGSGGEFPGEVKLEIEAPVGTPGVFMKQHSAYPHENELLLAAGTRYQVLEVDTSAYTTVIKVRVVTGK